MVALQRGRIGPALALIERALPALADAPDIHLNYGNALRAAGRLAEATASYRRALALDPDAGMAHNNLARVLLDLGEAEPALAAAERAARLMPDFAGAHANLAGALLALRRFAEAEKALRRALEIVPADAGLRLDLGVALHEQGQLDAAIMAFGAAAALRPDFAEAHNNLGLTLASLGRRDEAIASFQTALALAPGRAEIHHNLGRLLRQRSRPHEAARALRKALALRPELAAARLELGRVLADLGALDEAASELRQAADQIDAATIEWFQVRQRMCDWRDYAEGEERAKASEGGDPFALLGLRSTPAEQRAWAERAASRLEAPPAARLPARPAADRARLRIGYVSANFRYHAGASLVSGLIERHDRDRVEVIGYSAGPDDGSPARARLARAFDRFVDISSLSDSEAALRIHADEIDILVDLNGQTRHSRFAMFAHRPAPIQVAFLGYPGTSGASFIDYVVVDRFVAPPDQQASFTERLAYLPDCYQCNDDRREVAAETPTRADCGLPDEGFVFSCFNTPQKITPDVFDIWMRVLSGTPASVLWLIDDNPWARANLAREATARGVAAERLVFAPKLPWPAHLARHRLADLFLDTLPYNAHTTASDALWAGTPVLTRAGTTFAGRVCGSLLHAVGLPELVTHTAEDYEAAARRLARETDTLAALRAKLCRNRLACPLFDTTRFARSLERAYRTMAERRRSGLPPETFEIPPSD